MKTLSRDEAEEVFDRFWNEFQEEWFKCEVLQDYSGEDMGPSLEAWLAGDREKAIELFKEELEMNEWLKAVRLKQNIRKIRVHVVEEPYTPYLKWEIEAYKHTNVPAGEKVYLVPKEKVAHLKLPDGDFLIFDNKRVLKNTYDSSGRAVRIDVYDENDDISYFLGLREELLKYTEPIK